MFVLKGYIMKTKKEVAEMIRCRIAELEENIKFFSQCGDWEMVRMNQELLDLRKRELEIFK